MVELERSIGASVGRASPTWDPRCPDRARVWRLAAALTTLLAVACGRGSEPSGAPPEVAPASEGESPNEPSGRSGGGERSQGTAAAATASEPSSVAPAPVPPASPNSAPVVAPAPGRGAIARIETSMGTIRVRLDAEHAPQTVANFVQYANDHFYDGTIFHRVIDDFMIQGGGFEPGMRRKPTRAPIPLEIHPALRHVDGAIAMARTSDRNSATAQFYLCDGPQSRLDDGYAPFGRVIEGMEVVRRIAAVPTSPTDQPVTDVVIRSVRMEP